MNGSKIDIWDKAASAYDNNRKIDPVYSACINFVAKKIPKGQSICLDGGCGTGLSTLVLSERCDTIIGIDYSFESLKILKNRNLSNVMVIQADLTALPFRESVFNATVCANSLQHLDPNGSQQQAISEFNRVTKPHGKICVSVHHYSKKKRNSGWIKEGKPGQPGIDYIFRFSRDDLLNLLPNSSITGVGYYSISNMSIFGSRIQLLLATIFGKIAAILELGHMLVAVKKNEIEIKS